MNCYEFRGKDFDYIDEIATEVQRLVSVCDATLKRFDYMSGFSAWPEGWAWDDWIRHLTAIMNRHKLPTGVSKGSDEDSPSLFVRLVNALQALIPDEHRRSTHSKGALAQAIHKARRVSKPPIGRKRPKRALGSE